MLYAFSELE